MKKGHSRPEQQLLLQFRSLLPEAWDVELQSDSQRRWDALLHLPGHKHRLALEIKRDPRLRDFPFGIQQDELKGITPVLAAPRVPDSLREKLQEEGWGWMDGAGNAHLSVPGLILIDRSGHVPMPPERSAMNLGSSNALQVLRALLHPCHAEHRWSLRNLQKQCSSWNAGSNQLWEPSLGYLSQLTRYLQDEGYLQRDKVRGPTRVRDAFALIRAAARDYSVQRKTCFSLLSRHKFEAQLKSLALRSGGHAAWAAFSAADLLAPAVQESRRCVMVAARFVPEFMADLDTKEVDSGGNVLLLVPEDDGAFYMGESISDHARCTNAVQTYWDLLFVGGRGEEAAEAIYRKCLLPYWKSGGIA